jgi:hypothetical protein
LQQVTKTRKRSNVKKLGSTAAGMIFLGGASVAIPAVLDSPPAAAGSNLGCGGSCWAGFSTGSTADGYAGASYNLNGTCNDAVYTGEGVNSADLLEQSSQVSCATKPYSWVSPTFPSSKCASGCTSVLWVNNSVYVEDYEVFG